MKLVQLSEGLLTAYMANGSTRNAGTVPDEGRLVHVSARWLASPATAAALVALDADVVRAGGARIRLVDVYRDPVAQLDARRKYDAWVAAGKPPPGTAGFSARLMKTAYVAQPGESNHGWGAAIDIDQDALQFPGAARGTTKAMATFWPIAARHGFTPIIGHPSVDQSECWHFDHFGGLTPVYKLAADNGESRGNKLIAGVGATLMGTYRWPDGRSMERFVQARLLAGGYWCGWLDGQLGKLTAAALAEAKVKLPKGPINPSQAIAELDRLEVGTAAMAAM